MDRHFELTDKFIINAFGAKLFQIKCTRKIKYADIGDLGAGNYSGCQGLRVGHP